MLDTKQMKSVSLIFEIIILLVIAGFYFSQARQMNAQTLEPPLLISQTAFPSGQTDLSILGVFEGITPCSNVTRPVPHIPVDSNCEMMIWYLTLYQNPDTGVPTTYTLNGAYGMSQPNTTGIAGGGAKLDLEGRWEIIHGTKTDPEAVVYQLNPDKPEEAIYFIKMDDNVLHVLTPDKTLLVGNGGWGYTLNRTDAQRTIDASVSTPDLTVEDPSTPSLLEGSATSGVFEGRMPCADSVLEFTKIPYDPACVKIKMRLTLHQDPDSGEPTTYIFRGTATSSEGTWKVTRGIPAQPHGIVYHLNMDDTGRSIAFLKADDNHLFLLDSDLNLMVGDALWSYTLSRTG